MTNCTSCGEDFRSGSAFDKHRVGGFAGKGKRNTRHCLTVQQMLNIGMERSANGAWTTGVISRHEPIPVAA
jgi:hypothetical protein